MKSKKINNLLNIKSRKNKIKNNSTIRENFSNNKTLKNKQEKCEEENKPILKHFNITPTGLGDKLLDIWSAVTVSVLIKHKLYIKIGYPYRNKYSTIGKLTDDEAHNYNFNNIKIPNTQIISNNDNDNDNSYQLFSKGITQTIIDDKLHISIQRYMGTNSPYFIYEDREKYKNNKLKYNVEDYSYDEIIKIFKKIAVNTKLLLEKDDKNLNIYKNYIGIHIRLSDALTEWDSPLSMTNEYFNELESMIIDYCKILINNKNYHFVVCSDDNNYPINFKNKLLEINSNLNIIISNNTPEIDMTILSKTKEIIMFTKSSNFTICASLLGNTKIKSFETEINKLYNMKFIESKTYGYKWNEILRLSDNECILNKINIDYNIPKNCTHIKLDIGLSYNAPQSQSWLKKEDNLMVFGFEPNPDSVKCIQNGNIQKRNPSHGEPLQQKYINEQRFKLLPFALSNVEKQEEMTFYVNSNDTGTSSLFNHNEKELGKIEKIIKVSVISLKMFFDEFPWNRISYIDYIKIDAQGSDLNILKGAGNYLKERVVYVTAEPDGNQYIGADECNVDNITNYMISQNFVKINHPNTIDPTYVNKKFKDIAKKIYISQY